MNKETKDGYVLKALEWGAEKFPHMSKSKGFIRTTAMDLYTQDGHKAPISHRMNGGMIGVPASLRRLMRSGKIEVWGTTGDGVSVRIVKEETPKPNSSEGK